MPARRRQCEAKAKPGPALVVSEVTGELIDATVWMLRMLDAMTSRRFSRSSSWRLSDQYQALVRQAKAALYSGIYNAGFRIMDISVRELTTYQISADGESVALKMMDEGGNARALSFRIAELDNLVLTLPKMIEAALRKRFRDGSFRFTYPMGSWSIEQASDPGSVIVTLRTSDDFGVSFSMTVGKAEELGNSLTTIESAPNTVLAH